ncbi:MAG: glycosyltransferase family 39 protein [Deltaproteobacteria bacterium]|nr:glycosyltransferase family 39 protein [Deltaproteobacteria bacterium]
MSAAWLERARAAVAALSSRRGAAALVFVATLALHLALLPAQGLTDDDDFYAPAATSYVRWLGEALTSPATALSTARIDAAFTPNHEHPPAAKVVMGLSQALLHDGLGLLGALDGARAGVSLLAALLAAVLVLLLWEPLGPLTALAAPALLLSLPRFLFHSEVATLDVPVACAVVVVTAAFFWAEGSRRWALACGLLFGLALLVKVNAPFAALPCALWALAGRWRGVRIGKDGVSLPPVPRALVAMALFGPLLFVALWPWLWHDTFARLGAYLAFHLRHYPILLFYDGEIWEQPFAPWHAPLVLGLGVLPAPVLVLGLLGAGRAGRALWRLVRAADERGVVPSVSAADRLRALVVLQAVFAIGIVAFLDVPKYGGEKLFLPFFPLWCALAADGLALVADAAKALLPRALAPVLAATLLLAAVVPGALGSAKHLGGYALSYYGELVGGLRGAVARGYERSYYDVADKELARLLDQLGSGTVARGRRVHVEPNHKEYVRTFRWLEKDGVVGHIELVSDRARADVLVLTHERRWQRYPALKAELERLTPIGERRIDGVPLWTVYRR